MAARLRPEIFLSHAHQDRAFADRLVAVLRRHGLRVWYSRTHLVGAKRWHDEIGRALDRCDWCLVILSPEAVKSDWVSREVVYALNAERYRDRIVPLLYKRCRVRRLSWVLPEYQHVDFTTDEERGFAELLRVWNVRYSRARVRSTTRSRR